MKSRSGYFEHPEVIRMRARSQRLRKRSSGVLKRSSPIFSRWSGILMARNGRGSDM